MREEKEQEAILIDMAEINSRIEAQGWRITGIQVALKKQDKIQMYCPIQNLRPECAGMMEHAMIEAEKIGLECLARDEGKGGAHEPTIH